MQGKRKNPKKNQKKTSLELTATSAESCLSPASAADTAFVDIGSLDYILLVILQKKLLTG